MKQIKIFGVIGYFFRALPILLVFAGLGATIYAVNSELEGVGNGTVYVFVVIIILWIIGIVLTRKGKEGEVKKDSE